MFKKYLYRDEFNKKLIFIVITLIIITSITDVLLIKLYDLSSKKNVSLDNKKIGFLVMALVCFSLQLFFLRYTSKIIKNESNKFMNFRSFINIAKISYLFTILIMTILIFQLFYLSYYISLLLILLIIATYGTASFFIGKTSASFLQWYRRKRNFVILLYFISVLLILFNLILTVFVVNIFLIDRPEKIREFVGGTMDLSGGKYSFLVYLHKISSVLSFMGIWTATVVLSYLSHDDLVKRLKYLIMPSILLFYLLISYFSQDIFTPLFIPYLQSDPILFSMILLMIFTLIKPVGGIMFGITFWNISKMVNYAKTLEKYLIITGIGFLFLFTANQSTSLVLAPYPPFGIISISILIIGTYLIMIGIYMSAILVSKNIDLRKSIHRMAKESKLLELIGTAEMEKEVDKTVNKIMKEIEISKIQDDTNFELNKNELKNYLDRYIIELDRINKR